MIVFLNFAPIEFMGGAEQWMLNTSKFLNQKEKTILISVDPQISNLYSQLILKRKFDKRVRLDKNIEHISLTPTHFIPFTCSWYQTRKLFKQARLVYFKYELLESLICIYFGGLSINHKLIAGIHSPFRYSTPINFTENLHNFVYLSYLSKLFLKKLHKIHVITDRDKDYFSYNMGLKNTELVPNFIDNLQTQSFKPKISDRKYRILFVGELNLRKGTDRLIDVIRASSTNFQFNIVGDGQMAAPIKQLAAENPNVIYHGFLQKPKLYQLYEQSDALFIPSRAEGFPLVVLEALSFGLVIVDSKDIGFGLPKLVEQTVTRDDKNDYIQILKKVKSLTKNQRTKDHIHQFYYQHFNKHFILNQLSKKIFSLA